MAKIKAKNKQRTKSRVDDNGKFDAEAAAWSWIENLNDPINHKEIVEEHVRTAYRLNFPSHNCDEEGTTSCKKNCKQNPKCYVQLGREKWIQSPKETTCEELNGCNPDSEEEEDGTEFEKRPTFKENDGKIMVVPVGLKNLGNTCYVNSFLQIWFHNVQFRRAIYSWKPHHTMNSADLDTNDLETNINTSSDYKLANIIGSLQNLFAIMEFSPRRAVDPHDFITKLGLDPQVQQDAQEFSKLFLSLLEGDNVASNEKLKNNDPKIILPSMVKDQFRGNYEYVTKCCACNRQSKRPASFYELDLTLQGQKTLADCMNDFLHVEKLEGDNQYYCGGCQSKQDANRYVQLKSLPKVLNLQLNRFIYDMQTGRKKKLNSFVTFPEELDMSVYSQECVVTNNGSSKHESSYVLTGVLMHVGTDANHGHYAAHIKDISSGHWFKFSDTQVETLSGDEEVLLSASSIDDKEASISPVQKKNSNLSVSPSPKANRISDLKHNKYKIFNKLPKKLLRSNSAYMLVYAEKSWFHSTTQIEKEQESIRQTVKHLAEKGTNIPENIEENVRVTKLRGNRSVTILNSPHKNSFIKTNGKESNGTNSPISSEYCTKSPKSSSVDSRFDNNYVSEDKERNNATQIKDTIPLITSDERVSGKKPFSTKSKGSIKATHDVKLKRRFTESKSCGKCEGCMLPKCGQCIMCLEQPNTGTDYTNDNVCLLNQCHHFSKSNYNMLNSYPVEKSNSLAKCSSPIIFDKSKEKVEHQKNPKDNQYLKVTPTTQPTTARSSYIHKDYKYINGTVYPNNFPTHLIEYVEKDKLLFAEQLTEKRISKKEDKSKTAIFEEKMREVCQNMVYNSDRDNNGNFEFVPKKVLCQFLESSSTNENLINTDNSTFLCAHGNLDVDQLSELKLVTEYAADRMLQPERLKLKENLLCRNCIINRCRLKKLALRLAKDGKEITEMLKTPVSTKSISIPVNGHQTADGSTPLYGSSQILYWVGKLSLKKWKNMAKDNLHREVAAGVGLILGSSKIKDLESTSPKTNGQVNYADDSVEEIPNPISPTHEKAEYLNLTGGEYERFNEDISCKHGNLCPDFASKARMVPDQVWNKFHYYFGEENCPTFTTDSHGCKLCMDDAKSEAAIHEEKKDLALHQKTLLSDIFNERNRPTWSKSSINLVYLISRNFVESWRYFVRNPANRSPLTTIGNLALLCEHGLLAHPLRLDTESDYESIVYMVYEEEWTSLKRLFEIDKEICVTRNRGNHLIYSSHSKSESQYTINSIHEELLSSEPKACKECVEKKSREELEEKLTYTNAPIYVRKLTGSEKCDDPDFPGLEPDERLSDIPHPAVNGSEEVEEEKIDDQSHPPNKRKKTSDDLSIQGVSTTSPSTLTTLKNSSVNGSTDYLRRSNRRQKVRGEKEYLVNSTMLLRDFKVKIMETYKVAPFDQNLWVRGKYLTDPTQTLGQLRIFPKSLIYLRADEPNLPGTNSEKNLDEDTSWVVPQHDPQEGFKGTGLMSSVI